MSIDWSDVTFTPDEEAVRELARAWNWLVKEPFTPVLFSRLGDVFYRTDSGAVYWLNTGTGEISCVADSIEQFRERLSSELADEWLLPGLVEQLHASGKVPDTNACYTYKIFPVFAEGKYDVSNLYPISAKQHFGLSGDIHRQIQDVPDGSQVRLSVGRRA